MDEMKLDNFYKNWLKNLPQLTEGYIYDNNKNLLPTRYLFRYFKKIINDFLVGKISEFEKIILLSEIRRVGKTTILLQILKMEKFLNFNNSLGCTNPPKHKQT